MIINSHTKISELLKENSQALDAISSLAKPLEKLRNPILRKLLASRTTIKEAASIGGCSMEEFFLVLKPLGFEMPDMGAGEMMPESPVEKPDWLKALPTGYITSFDVRAMLSSGHDPLKEIMAEFKKVRPGTALKIINTFIPTPLLRLLENKGALTYAQTIEPRLTHSYFYKPAKEATAASTINTEKKPESQTGPMDLMATVDETTFKTALDKLLADHIKAIDVRALEMPEPMHKILGELEKLPKGYALYVHHKRIPVYLLEDLQSSGRFKVLIWVASDTEVKLLLTHQL